MTTAVATVLMTEEEARACVSRIRSGMENVLSLILDLHEREGWRALGYASWRACVSAEFDMSQSRAYQLLDLANINRALSTIVENGPIPEAHARELTPLKDEPERVREVYQRASEKSGDQPTAKAVRAEVDAELGRPARPKPARERRSISSSAERSDFADAPDDDAALGYADAPAEAQTVSNEPAIHGQPERFCSACGDRYRGDACPCLTVTPEREPPAVSAQSAPVVYQPAPRTSSVSVGKSQPAPTAAVYSGPPPLTLTSDAAGTMRAVADRWPLDKVAEAIAEAYEPQRLRSLVVQVIDALPIDLLTSVAHRVNVRVRPAETGATEMPDSASLADWEQAAVARLTPGTRIGLVKRLIDGLAEDQQRRFWEMYPEQSPAAPTAAAEPVTLASLDVLAGEYLTVGQQLGLMSRLLDRQDEKGRRALYDRLKLQFDPPSARELLTGKAI